MELEEKIKENIKKLRESIDAKNVEMTVEAVKFLMVNANMLTQKQGTEVSGLIREVFFARSKKKKINEVKRK